MRIIISAVKSFGKKINGAFAIGHLVNKCNGGNKIV